MKDDDGRPVGPYKKSFRAPKASLRDLTRNLIMVQTALFCGQATTLWQALNPGGRSGFSATVSFFVQLQRGAGMLETGNHGAQSEIREGMNLRHASLMSLSLKDGLQKRLDDVERSVPADEALADAENVRVVVLAGELCRR